MKKELIIGTVFLGCSAILAGCGTTTHSAKAVTHPQTVQKDIQKNHQSTQPVSSSITDQDSATTASSSNSQSNSLSYDARHLSGQQLGTLICLLKDPDEFKGADNGQPGGLYYGSVPQGSDYGQQGEWTFSQRMAIQQVTFTLNPMVRMSSLNTLMMTERLAASLMHQLKPNRSRFND